MPDFDPAASPAARIEAVARFAEGLATSDLPIVVGPWRSEVGFESLYWLAWLQKLASVVPKFRERAIVLTRGGMGALYSHVAERSIDLYRLRSVVDLRRQNLFDHQRTALQKQLMPTEWDARLVEDAVRAAGLSTMAPYHTVHPAWMYWSCAPYWDEACGLQHLATLTDHAPIPKPTLAEGCPLPPRYVAVKFYNRATFPILDPRHRDLLSRFVARTVGTIAEQIPVVWLQSAPEHDDHADVPIKGKNISALAIGQPESNLFEQATVIAHATAFVGVYGGMAQFALRMGVPSVSFYHQWGATAHAHLSLSSALSKKFGTEFLVGNLDDAALWQQVVSSPVHQAKDAPALPAPSLVTA